MSPEWQGLAIRASLRVRRDVIKSVGQSSADFNLLYHRIAFGTASNWQQALELSGCGLPIRDTAD